jgi:tRNA A-37 threonylcarbamoyl transferase component Bud32
MADERPPVDPTRTQGTDPTKLSHTQLHSHTELPERIGEYRIRALIGHGGMGAVYEAEQDRPKRTVALKVIRSSSLSPALSRRFELEAELLGRLQHPGIAHIYEAGVAVSGGHSQPFFAMELIQGQRLDAYLDSKRCSTQQRLELLAKVCDAVQHAHQKGVIHRDLKPGNILVDVTGQPKVVDFGLARAVASEVESAHTEVGAFLGTLPYMSPEQVSGDPSSLDTRSDVYSLGVILYEILAGRLPYAVRRAAIHEAIRVIREEEPASLSSTDRKLRGDIEAIVGKALEKDKDRRYASAAELGADIRRFLKDEPITAAPPNAGHRLWRSAKRHRGFVAAAMVILTTLSLGLVLTLREARRAERAEEAALAEKAAAIISLRQAEAALDWKNRAEVGLEMVRQVMGSQESGRELLRTLLSQAAEDRPYPDGRAALVLLAGRQHLLLGEYAEARAKLRDYLAGAQRTLPRGVASARAMWLDAYARLLLGTALLTNKPGGAIGEAEALLAAGRTGLGGAPPEVVADAFNRVALQYDSLGRSDDADFWRAQFKVPATGMR